jgi:hypothetical protein
MERYRAYELERMQGEGLEERENECAAGFICFGCKDLLFTLVSGGDNYGNCNGNYVLDSRTINAKPIYINAINDRFLAWTLNQWTITSMFYLDDCLALQGNYGGFQVNNGNVDPRLGWDNYIVTQGPYAYVCMPCKAGTYSISKGAFLFIGMGASVGEKALGSNLDQERDAIKRNIKRRPSVDYGDPILKLFFIYIFFIYNSG